MQRSLPVQRVGPVALAYAAAVFTAVPPILLLFAERSLSFSPAMIPLTLIILYSSGRLVFIVSSARQKIVTTTFWIFVYVFLGVAPLLQVASGTFPWPGSYNDGLLLRTTYIILAGLLAFEAGQRLLPVKAGLGVPRLLQRPLRKSTVVLLAIVALALTAVLLQRLGGLDLLFSSRLARSQFLTNNFTGPQSALLNQLARTPVYVLLMAALAIQLASRHGGRARTRFGWKALVVILLISTIVLNNPIGIARLKVGTIVLSLFFILPWRRWFGVATVGLGIMGLVLVFPFADLFRYSLNANLPEQIEDTSVAQELTTGDFDAFQMIANTAKVTDREGFQFGRQVGGALLFWVPRSAWPGKPLPTGELVAEKLGYEFTNLSSPLWAELYIDGGFLLVVLGFFAYGYFVRVIDSWNRSNQQHSEARVVSVLAPIYAGYQLYLLRGALMPAVAYFVPIILVAVLFSIHLGSKRLRVSVQNDPHIKLTNKFSNE